MKKASPRASSGSGAKWQCKACKSLNLRAIEGELTASFPEMTYLKSAPVYVCRELLVCLDCGLAELVIPRRELRLIKKGSAGRNS